MLLSQLVQLVFLCLGQALADVLRLSGVVLLALLLITVVFKNVGRLVTLGRLAPCRSGSRARKRASSLRDCGAAVCCTTTKGTTTKGADSKCPLVVGDVATFVVSWGLRAGEATSD